MTSATKAFWQSTHPWGDDIRIADLRVLSIMALVLGLLATATVATMFFVSGLFPFERMNYYIIGRVAGGGTFEADTRTFATIALSVSTLSLLMGVVAAVMVRRTTRGVYLVGILSMLLATLIAPYFIASGILVIAAGPRFEGAGNPVYAIPSLAGFVITPLVAVAVAFLGSYVDKRARPRS